MVICVGFLVSCGDILSEKASIIKEQTEWLYGSLARTCEGLTEKEASWKPTEASNNIAWQLNHLSRITNQSIPRIIKGDPKWSPEGWPEDYRDQSYSIEKMLGDIEAGKERVLKGLEGLSTEDFEEEISYWGGTRQRKTGVFAYIGELAHHKGQIAYIRGSIKRLKELDPDFLK